MWRISGMLRAGRQNWKQFDVSSHIKWLDTWPYADLDFQNHSQQSLCSQVNRLITFSLEYDHLGYPNERGTCILRSKDFNWKPPLIHKASNGFNIYLINITWKPWVDLCDWSKQIEKTVTSKTLGFLGKEISKRVFQVVRNLAELAETEPSDVWIAN